MHQERGQARIAVWNFDRLDSRPADHGGGFLEQAHRIRIDVHAALRARMNEAFAGLVVAAGAHETCGRGETVAGALGFAAARRDLVAHPYPFLEPGIVVADLVEERAADAVDLVDLDADPRRRGQANQQAHRPAIIVREVEEGRIVFFCVGLHGCLLLFLPPCGGGLGRGSSGCAPARTIALRLTTPPLTPPHKGEGKLDVLVTAAGIAEIGIGKQFVEFHRAADQALLVAIAQHGFEIFAVHVAEAVSPGVRT